MDQSSIVLRNTFHLSRLTRNDLRMLLTFLGRVGDERRIELLHLSAAAFRACHLGGFMLLQRQDHQRFLPAVQTFIVVHRHKVPFLTLFTEC